MKSSLGSLQLEKALEQQQTPSTAKDKIKYKVLRKRSELFTPPPKKTKTAMGPERHRKAFLVTRTLLHLDLT